MSDTGRDAGAEPGDTLDPERHRDPVRDMGTVTEGPLPQGEDPLVVHADWAERFPWLFQGTTHASPTGDFDLRFFGGEGRAPGAGERLSGLAERNGFEAVTLSHQVHGASVLVHSGHPPGLNFGADADGHLTATRGLLLAVTVADCVPVSIVDERLRCISLLHAGWRSVVAGILERGVSLMRSTFGSRTDDLWVHLGPAICGECYEVGPEVFEALGLAVPARPTPIDLRAVLATRATVLGIDGSRVTRSTHCTRCGDVPFFSHRGGASGRQMALLGLRPGADG